MSCSDDPSVGEQRCAALMLELAALVLSQRHLCGCGLIYVYCQKVKCPLTPICTHSVYVTLQEVARSAPATATRHSLRPLHLRSDQSGLSPQTFSHRCRCNDFGGLVCRSSLLDPRHSRSYRRQGRKSPAYTAIGKLLAGYPVLQNRLTSHM